jgi:hypothetical protein
MGMVDECPNSFNISIIDIVNGIRISSSIGGEVIITLSLP